jgi:GPH family glycoside/pentoside/hexuronide:cation symporter
MAEPAPDLSTIEGQAPPRTPPLKIDLAYALINLAGSIIWSVLSWWLSYFYLPPEGEGLTRVPVALYGVVVFGSNALNALMAPLIGRWSDRTRSPWGRRLPFMFAAALPMLACFVLLWTPPVAGTSAWNLVYLGLVLTLYNTAYTLNQIPYTALLPELARTDQHRVRLSAWTSGFLLIGTLLSGGAGPLIERWGYPTMALAYAAVCLPAFYLPFLVLKEPPSARTAPVPPTKLERGIRTMLRNRAFRVMTGAGLCYWGITTLVMSAIPYVVTEVCLLDQADTWAFYTPAILATLVCYPLVTWLANRVGKWRVFAGSLLASALVLPALMLIGPWAPLSLKAQGILWVTLQAIALSGVTMLPPAFGAEVVDDDAARTGQRREGMIYATWGLLSQVTNGLAAVVWSLLLLLGRSHTAPQGPLGVRMTGVVGGALLFVGFVIFLRYPFRGRGTPAEVAR